ncbi:hypothetical protein [Bosea sp. TAF32]|uniref:hypothetical protein n=1 Tax=Bosea sp. TAF32 TaxID=3237482 RepID=UPI003F8D986F
MAEIKHSTSPWHADPKAPEDSYFEDVSILREDGLAVGVAVHNGDISPEEVKANAFVMAAAPEMQAALRGILSNPGGRCTAEQWAAGLDARAKSEGRHV